MLTNFFGDFEEAGIMQHLHTPLLLAEPSNPKYEKQAKKSPL
jgi:hypothetical protein